MSPAALRLARDFLTHAPRRAVPALGLVILSAVLESAGILLLIPIIGLAFGDAVGGWVPMAFFNVVGAETPLARMAILLGFFCAVLALRLLVSLKRDLALFDLTQGFIASLRARAFRALAARPWPSLARLERDRVGHALCRDVDRVEGAAMAMLGGTVALAVIVVQGLLALAVAPVLAAGALALGAFGLLALRRFRQRATERGARYGSDDLTLYRSAEDFLGGLKPAKAHGLEDRYATMFERAVDRRLSTMRLWIRDQALARLLIQSGAAVSAVVAVTAGVFWLGTDPAALIVLVAVLARLWGPLQTLQQSAQVLNHAAEGYAVTRDLAGERPVAPAFIRRGQALDAAPEIRLDGVSVLSDESGQTLLDRIDAVLPAGRVTALTGLSGAGKSTFADLVSGLRTPDRGLVFLDGAPLADRAAELAGGLAWVGQESFMPMPTLRETLAWGALKTTDDAVMAALERVGAANLVRALDGGLDGRILSGGIRFSGGERQRIALARALLRDPKLLVLDEATNALDAQAERAVLSRLFADLDATILMITHREAAARLAQHRIRLEHGRALPAAPSASVRHGARTCLAL